MMPKRVLGIEDFDYWRAYLRPAVDIGLGQEHDSQVENVLHVVSTIVFHLSDKNSSKWKYFFVGTHCKHLNETLPMSTSFCGIMNPPV